MAADLALYAVKADSRGAYKFYNRAMNSDLNDRRELEMNLRDAIERGVPVFDFLRGEEPYKYAFGPTPHDLFRVSVRP